MCALEKRWKGQSWGEGLRHLLGRGWHTERAGVICEGLGQSPGNFTKVKNHVGLKERKELI